MSPLRGLATLLVTVTIALVLGLLVLGTAQGSAWLIGNFADLAGDRLSLTGIRGTLLEGLAVDRLQISAGRTTVLIEPAELRMNWPDLLRRRVRLTTARAEVVRIDIAPRPPDEPESVVEPLLLPVVIAADSLEIRRLVIRNGVNRDAGSTEQIVPVEIGPVTLRGELVDGVLQFESLQAELYGITARASGAFGTGEPFALDARLEWQMAEPAVTGSGALAGDLAALRFEQVVRLPEPMGVGGVAHLLQDQPEIVAEARWTHLQKSLGEDPDMLLRSDAGRLSVRGWTHHYVAELNAAVRLGEFPQVQARATVEGDTQQLQLTAVRVKGFGGQITGTGHMTLQDPVTGSLQLQARGIDPRFLDPRFAGRVDVRGTLDFDSVGNFQVKVPDSRMAR